MKIKKHIWNHPLEPYFWVLITEFLVAFDGAQLIQGSFNQPTFKLRLFKTFRKKRRTYIQKKVIRMRQSETIQLELSLYYSMVHLR